MRPAVIQIAEDYWNVRGSFRIAGVIDVGTHVSLVRRKNGKFVFLDSYTLRGAAAKKIAALTDDGHLVEAVLNLHPFHTIHVADMHKRFPQARLYGTKRHVAQAPDLPWEQRLTEDAELHDEFSKDFDFSVPRGVDFVSDNGNVHFSSVLALHRESQTIHVDDTFMYLRLPLLLRWFSLHDAVSFHPTLAQALEKRAGAAADFRSWAEDLIERWQDAQNLCAAHSATLTSAANRGATVSARLRQALRRAEATLRAHERKYG